MTTPNDLSVNRTARVAGGLYLGIVPLSAFGLLYVPSAIVVEGNADATVHNIVDSSSLFRAGIASHLAAEVLLLLVALTLYRLLETVSRAQARLMVALVLASIPIAVLSEVSHLGAVLLVGGSYRHPADQLYAQVAVLLEFASGAIVVAQIFWGLWLLPLAILVFRSTFLPRALGVLVGIAGVGYVLDSVREIVLPSLDITISWFTFVGELLLPLWLLVKGVDRERWQARSAAASSEIGAVGRS